MDLLHTSADTRDLVLKLWITKGSRRFDAKVLDCVRDLVDVQNLCSQT
jgi:hypothetical protein